MRRRRVVAIWVPGLPLQCAARDDVTLREQPVAVADDAIVLARNRRAAEAGISAGMRVAEAVTHAADLLLVPDDPQGVQAVWDAALLHLDDLGPVVEDAGLGHALVDISGVGGNERAIVRRTLRGLGALLDLTARAAIADGPYVASVAARKMQEASNVAVIPQGRGAEFLAPLPVALLPLPEQLADDLLLLGVRTIGGFAALRPSDVQQRFGAVGLAALALAIGQDTRPLFPRPRERSETLGHTFEPPVDDLSPMLFIAKALLDGHAAGLRREGRVAGGLRLTLASDGRDPLVIEQRWGAPCIPGRAALDGVRLALDRHLTGEDREGAAARIVGVSVTLLDLARDAGMQLPLIGAATIQRQQAVAHLLTRLRALLGPHGVVEATLVDAHLPEEGWRTRPYDAARVGTPLPETIAPSIAAIVPYVPGFSLCHPPEPLDITWQNDAIAAIGTDAGRQEVVAALGPYLADGKWWEAGAYRRAYWIVMTADQALHLVAYDRAGEQWTRVGGFG